MERNWPSSPGSETNGLFPQIEIDCDDDHDLGSLVSSISHSVSAGPLSPPLPPSPLSPGFGKQEISIGFVAEIDAPSRKPSPLPPSSPALSTCSSSSSASSSSAFSSVSPKTMTFPPRRPAPTRTMRYKLDDYDLEQAVAVAAAAAAPTPPAPVRATIPQPAKAKRTKPGNLKMYPRISISRSRTRSPLPPSLHQESESKQQQQPQETITTQNENENENENENTNQANSKQKWTPGIRNQISQLISPLIAFLVILLSAILSIIIICISSDIPVNSWARSNTNATATAAASPIRPSILLSLFSSLTNAGLALLFADACRVAWWTRAMVGRRRRAAEVPEDDAAHEQRQPRTVDELEADWVVSGLGGGFLGALGGSGVGGWVGEVLDSFRGLFSAGASSRTGIAAADVEKQGGGSHKAGGRKARGSLHMALSTTAVSLSMFLSGPLLQAASSTEIRTTTGEGQEFVYTANYVALAAYLIFITVSLALVIPLFDQFWILGGGAAAAAGRGGGQGKQTTMTLSPIQIARAFDAPILQRRDHSDGGDDDDYDDDESTRIQYGVVVERLGDDGMRTRGKLRFGLAGQVGTPVAGMVYR